MRYQPVTAVWEITMGCNLRCIHCGSSCEKPIKGELTTSEAVDLCKDIGELGLKWLTLSGGEPTLRKDWHIIARALHDNGVIPNIITNGWVFSEEIIDKVVKSKINTVAISLDGIKSTHDSIRRDGSYDRVMDALELFKGRNDINSSVITTINRQNINQLQKLLKILNEKEVRGWQLQIGLPMGNMLNNKDMIIKPSDTDKIIEFAYESMKDKQNKVKVQLADCLGYYNIKEIEVRRARHKSKDYNWFGCNAGKYSFGILHNGDVIGCTSVRDKEYIEGNIRKTSLKEIWESKDTFKWNRELKKEKLKGFCSKCGYGESCLGGCANTRVTMENDVYGENKYCSYNYAVKIAENELNKDTDLEELYSKAKIFIKKNNFQLAEICLSKIIEKDETYKSGLSLYGYVSFMLGNYEDSKYVNKKILDENPDDIYANKGIGLCLARTGELQQGIKHLKKSVAMADSSYMDPYYDLAVIYYENKLINEAIEILEDAYCKNIEFKVKTKKFYDSLIKLTV